MPVKTADQERSSNETHALAQDQGPNPQSDEEFHHPQVVVMTEQVSIFSILPSELVLEIFSHMDIVTIFRFLDTCRYHRQLLLNMPEIWQRVYFVPLSEYATKSSFPSSSVNPLSTLSILSTAVVMTKTADSATSIPSLPSSSFSPSYPNFQFPKAPYQRRQRPYRAKGSSSGSSSDSDESDGTASKESENAAHKLKHAENERDRERGGSRTLISEIYAVLRRFRKGNRLVEFVREIYMDGTDYPQFPSPLVMLIKFPNLEILSSRYRRKQTSLTTDAHTLKDMLRNGDIAPHSLRLRRWDIFHPYMTKEDVTGFKNTLNSIAIRAYKETTSPAKRFPQESN
ncbi:hypothetical protein BGZ65_001937 [Modicella reniformis]|uniref:F-box domain-containing protein n=1 Tax=Modicella reniformis TaxID=1440133 RepID=A0A9P6ILD2_9FUNG|nr:hypothetical protein BGZ65_001937 [Modicella reniformis]